jgi:hypothetical protein
METPVRPPASSLEQEGPGRRHGRRRRQLSGLVAGAVIGWVIGFGIE